MSEVKRLLMKIDLSSWSSHHESAARKILNSDRPALGEVMYEAYRGTLDYSGETLEESSLEIAQTLDGKYGAIISQACLVVEADGKIASAVIFNWFEREKMPLMTFSMTRDSQKGKGYAKKLIRAGLGVLAREKYSECCLVVTDGNEPALSIYKSLGFRVV